MNKDASQRYINNYTKRKFTVLVTCARKAIILIAIQLVCMRVGVHARV